MAPLFQEPRPGYCSHRSTALTGSRRGQVTWACGAALITLSHKAHYLCRIHSRAVLLLASDEYLCLHIQPSCPPISSANFQPGEQTYGTSILTEATQRCSQRVASAHPEQLSVARLCITLT